MKIKNDKLKIKNEEIVNYYNVPKAHHHLSFVICLLSFLVVLTLALVSCAGKQETQLQTVKVRLGSVKAEVPSTGIVEPRNRLEIKPPIAGRVDQVLVQEGQSVKKGQILAWMSSSDRAALLDAARAKGAAEVKKWEDVYKPTPIVAPLNGFIIQRAIEPGQSVTSGDAILVMADYLIVKAQVDETDIGNIKLGQVVNIVLDAYPEESIQGKVEHIAFESKVVSNVTIYEVDILPGKVPAFFRAGMSATVNFVLQEKNNVLLLPLSAVKKIGDRSYVFVQQKDGKKPEPIQIKTGLENTLNLQIEDGLSEGDEVFIPNVEMLEDLNKKFTRRRGPTNPLQRRD
jgi:macrolide-specific efflux system membrane fusion protein